MTRSGTTSVQLARHLGLFEAVMIGVGAMIGAGIFVLTGIASGLAGPAALFAFGLNGLVTLFTALSYAELSSAIPEAGGGYSFVKKVMPNAIAFMCGWMLWFAYVAACSLYAKGFGSYFLELFDRYFPTVTHQLVEAVGHEWSVALLTIAVGAVFLAINIIGAHASGKTENVITLAKIAILCVFITFGLRQVWHAPELARTNFTPLLPNGVGGVLAAMGLTFIAFEGYDLIATVSEEVKDPCRTIPKAILYSLAITIAIYLLVVFVCLAAFPSVDGVPAWRQLGKHGELGIVQAAQSFMPKFGVILMLGGGLFATLSALNATILACSRVAFSMGRDWMLPNTLSRIHSVRRTPVVAISVSGVLFLGVAVLLPLATIGTASSLLFLLTFAFVNAALLMYRSRSTSPPPPFRVPLYPLTPILGMATCAGLAAYQLFHQTMAATLAAGWVIVGLGVYALFFSRRASIADVSRTIESPELLVLKKARRYRVLVPLSDPERVESLVEMAGRVAGASSGEVIALNVVALPDVTAYSEAEPFTNQAQSVLNQAQHVAIQQRLPFSSLLKIGRHAAKEIVEVAREHHCRLILMGYKKEEDPLENSVIYHVLVRQPCDVAILKCDPTSSRSYRRVLVPIGGKEVHDRLKARLVHSLGQKEPCHVTFLTVVPPGANALSRRRAEEALNHAASIYQIPDVELALEENDQPAQAIIARAEGQDLLLLGTHEEPWLKSFFFGTLAQQVAGQVHCPTLLVKAWSPERARLRSLLKLPSPPSERTPSHDPTELLPGREQDDRS